MIRVSVVVPTYRRPDLLDRCLAALAAQDLDPAAFEVIVADDAASEATRRQVEALGRPARPCRSATSPSTGRHGPAAARNVGWRAAAGRGHRLHRRRLRARPRLAGRRARPRFERRGGRRGAGRVVVPLPDAPTDYERDAAGPGTGRVRHGQLLLPARRAGGRRRVRRAVRRRLARGQRPALRPARARPPDRRRRPSAVVVHPVRPAPWGVSLRSSGRACSTPCSTRSTPTSTAAGSGRRRPGTITRSSASLGRAAVAASARASRPVACVGGGRLGGADGPVLRPAAAADLARPGARRRDGRHLGA